MSTESVSDMTYAALDEVLRRLDVEQSAAEFHGAMCGRLCVAADELPEALPEEPLLQRLRDQSLASFNDPGAGFHPLLPSDDAALADRVEALGQWCTGFLFGLGSESQTDLTALSADAQEMVADLNEIGHAGITPAANTEDDEVAYAEIVEYVRVGAQLVFLEARGLRNGSATPTLH